MNIVIVGAGAIGLLFYQQLYTQNKKQAQRQLALKARKQGPAHFSFTHFQGLSYQIPINYTDQQSIANADVILICVKSYQIDQALNQLIPYLPKKINIILCHNGMGVLTKQTLLDLSAQQPLLTLLTTHGSKKTSACHIIHTGLGFCDLGLLQGKLSSEDKNQLIAEFANSQLNVHWQNNISEKQWLKLAINCVINPLTAINNINNGELYSVKYQQTIKTLIQEFISVAASQGQNMVFEDVYALVMTVAEKTALNCSSMRSDVIKQQPTEINYINGYLVTLADKANINVPENKKLCQQINQLTKLY